MSAPGEYLPERSLPRRFHTGKMSPRTTRWVSKNINHKICCTLRKLDDGFMLSRKDRALKIIVDLANCTAYPVIYIVNYYWGYRR